MIPLSAINQLSAAYRGAARQEAYLELAQEHFLDWMRTQHLFEDEAVVFKGGTAIRKFVLGKDGRFSTDLDFAVADPAYADHLLDELASSPTHHGVTFVLDDHDPVARKGTWHAETPEHGRTLPTSLDFSPRPLLLPPVYPPRAAIPGVAARWLGFDPVTPPVADILETVAEKLSRFRRVMLGRDVYDLAAVGRQVEGRLELLREVLCFKSYFDRVEEGRDTLPVPFIGGAEFTSRDARDVIGADDLGRLVQGALDPGAMLTRVAAVYGRMGVPTSPDEVRLAHCRVGDHYWARTRYAARAVELRAVELRAIDAASKLSWRGS